VAIALAVAFFLKEVPLASRETAPAPEQEQEQETVAAG